MKNSMIKDALILCAITFVLGAVLAGVNALTKNPIEQANKKANNEACQQVISEGDSVLDSDATLVEAANAYMAKHDLSNEEKSEGDLLSNYVEIEEVHKTNNNGYVFLGNARKGYGGNITFSLGVSSEGEITGIKITSQSETAGLGANCTKQEWQDSFKGKVLPDNAGDEMYNKKEATDSQVQALSDATVTSRAIARAVKGILFYAEAAKEGE